MESEILQKIDFDIPIEFPYLELTDCFDKKIKDKTESLSLVSQCLGFLKEGIMHSSDFSLCPDLGRHILALYMSRTFQDSRLKQVYGLIKQKRDKNQRKEAEVWLSSSKKHDLNWFFIFSLSFSFVKMIHFKISSLSSTVGGKSCYWEKPNVMSMKCSIRRSSKLIPAWFWDLNNCALTSVKKTLKPNEPESSEKESKDLNILSWIEINPNLTVFWYIFFFHFFQKFWSYI